MELKYVDPRAMDRYLGKLAPFGDSRQTAIIIDDIIRKLNDDEGVWPDIDNKVLGFADKMIEHNRNRRGLPPWEMWHGSGFGLHLRYDDNRFAKMSLSPDFLNPAFQKLARKEWVVQLHIDHIDKASGTHWDVSVPLQILMKGWTRIQNEHITYRHGILLLDGPTPLDGSDEIKTKFYYVGVTRRSWLTRMIEHFNEIRSGSNKTFHRAWRQFAGQKSVRLRSQLVHPNFTFEQSMAWEEAAVDRYTDMGISLNMIPGGFKGIKFLHEHSLLRSTKGVTLKERERAIEAYQRINPRAGVPNLLISALWKDDAYAAKVICGVEGRLSVDQVLRIRDLNGLGVPVEKIAEIVGARNVRQVAGVLTGEHYARIH